MKAYINKSSKKIAIHNNKNLAAVITSDKDYPEYIFGTGELLLEFLEMDFTSLIKRTKYEISLIEHRDFGEKSEAYIRECKGRVRVKLLVELELHPYLEYSPLKKRYSDMFSPGSRVKSKDELINGLLGFALDIEAIEKRRIEYLNIMEFLFGYEKLPGSKLINKYYIMARKYPFLNKFNIPTQKCYSNSPGDVNMELSNDITDDLECMRELDKDMELQLLEIYDVDVVSLAYVELLACIEANVKIRQCRNCGNLFFPEHNRRYCEREYEDGKTCRDIGAASNYKKSLSKDPMKRTYTNIYRGIRNNEVGLDPYLEEPYKKWKRQSGKIYENAIKKNLSQEALAKKLKSSWERVKEENKEEN